MTEYKHAAGKRFITFPPPGRSPNALVRAARRVWSLIFLPYALLMARRLRTPGLHCRIDCVKLGVRALLAGDVRRAMKLIADPLDSFRYFELDFVLSAVRKRTIRRYLDVSSPRLAPLLILRAHRDLMLDMINPLPGDLEESAALSRSVGLHASCRFKCSPIESADFADETFDLITSVSVVEHIPKDTDAIAAMWRMLKTGGKLLVTVPCAREACEEYTNLDEYALLKADTAGYVYWQRYYNEQSLRERIWSVTGRPTTVRIFGETLRGIYDRNVEAKRTDPHYRYWEEPILMGRQFRYFERFEDLVGMGVVAMEFTKSARTSEKARE